MAFRLIVLVLFAKIIDWKFKVNARKTAQIWTCRLCRFFGVKEKFFCAAFIRFNLVATLNRFLEEWSLEDLELTPPTELKRLQIHNSTATRSRCHISVIWQIVNWFDKQRGQNTRQNEAVTVSLILRPPCPPPPLPTDILYSPQFRSHQETEMAARRTQRSTTSISRKIRGLWTLSREEAKSLRK